MILFKIFFVHLFTHKEGDTSENDHEKCIL